VRHHHERWDGTGYPDGLKGEAIPLAARIIGAADTWDACTSVRPYQAPMPPEEAIKVVHQLRGRQLDPKVADALERVVRYRIARGAGGGAEPARSRA
jgi:HD-GYP domain-containing protein (c-di-GMP phosphodiesterase class II)